MRRILAVVAAALGLLVAAGQATAAPGDSALDLAAQAVANAQAAGAQSGAAQSQPTNTNISVRVLSEGDDGDVTQSNTVSSNATAANANVTGQSAEQTQSGACGCNGGTQATGQEADSSQTATAASYASQSGASNTNIPVRVLSPGDNGNVTQSNTVQSGATAANANATGQSAGQAASGGSGTQATGQEASNTQHAAAASAAEQKGAENRNISVRVLSPGDNGTVTQSNTVASAANAGNLNLTGQHAAQVEGGSGGTQAIGQDADNDQSATSLSAAKQDGATNTNIPVRVLSQGDGGEVSQSNSVESKATALNINLTGQKADQGQAGDCKCASGGLQAIGQEAKNEQDALALSAALQSGAANENTPVRVDSKGDDGDVTQSNSVNSYATALNGNLTKQDADQIQGGSSCGCGSNGIQAIGQEAYSKQGAAALSLALQHGASNENAPVRVDSSGGGGSVDQSNSVGSAATAANLNALGQDADQAQGGGRDCGCNAIAIQAIGQSAKSDQQAIGLSAALQFGASNRSRPVEVGGDDHRKADGHKDGRKTEGRKDGGGDVSQSNSVASKATALNSNLTKQDADQDQGGRGTECGCQGAIGIQALGQEAKNEQGALAGSLAIQAFGRDRCGCLSGGNSNAPVGVGSHGSGGSVDQSNDVSSAAQALNLNALYQGATQGQSGGGGTQALGQSAKNHQDAIGLSAALQLAGFNAKGRSHAE